MIMENMYDIPQWLILYIYMDYDIWMNMLVYKSILLIVRTYSHIQIISYDLPIENGVFLEQIAMFDYQRACTVLYTIQLGERSSQMHHCET